MRGSSSRLLRLSGWVDEMMKKETLHWLGLAAISATLFGGCTHRETTKLIPVRRMASTVEMPALEQGEQWDAKSDAETDQVIAINEKMLIERTVNESFIYRDAHPKHHGCVKAFFEVDSSGLPPELRVGVSPLKWDPSSRPGCVSPTEIRTASIIPTLRKTSAEWRSS